MILEQRMTDRTDPQEIEDRNHQRGETEPGFRKTADVPGPTPDRGILREDTELVTTPEDGRAPNWPETYEADKGPMSTEPDGDDAHPKGRLAHPEELEEGYTVDDGALKKQGAD